MLAPIVLASGPVILGAGKDKKKNAPPAYTLVAGTVFRDTGLVLAGAEVVLTSTGDAEGARKYKNRAATDSRGEFAFRAPAGPGRYTLSVKAHGYQPQEKPVSITTEDSIDVFLRLEPASQ